MTVLQWLTELAGKTESNEADSRMMQNLLRKTGSLDAVVTCGIVYLEGKGTIEAPPMDIHSIAKAMLPKAS